MNLFRLTKKQQEANALLASAATYILLYGGSRSAKTFTLVRAIVIRALAAANSRHAIVGFRFNRVKTAVGMDTLPKVMRLCFPDCKYVSEKTEWYFRLPNGSEIWLCGLDDKERTEKVLGKEFATILFNECSQISHASMELALTRLAQAAIVKVDGQSDIPLRLKAYYDENPPRKNHWTYKLFIKKISPDSNRPLPNPDDYACLQMNPKDNIDNLGRGYLARFDSMSAANRRRFRDGEFGDDNPNQLFNEDTIEKYRVIDVDELPDMVRIVVGVDPSGADDTDNEDNDAIGIVIAGLGVDGNAYVLEDRTVKAGPAVWGKVATDAYEYHDADKVIGEQNFGGAMVRHVIRTANPRVPYGKVTATRGKVVRAEPVSALYEQGKVRHVGYMHELEEELTGFTTHGFVGTKSPNRADAAIWCIYSLFPSLTRKPEEIVSYEQDEPFDPAVGI